MTKMTHNITRNKNIPIEDIKVPVDVLKEVYLDIKKKLVRPEEIGERDMTPVFWRGLRQKIMKGENPSIAICGQQTTGKSTCACSIGVNINGIIKELKPESSLFKRKELSPRISANQIEYLRVCRLKDIYYEVTLIDEWSDMGRSGNNGTVEENLMNWYYKVGAQKYLVNLLCTPKRDYDKYALLILEIIDSDKKLGITKAKLFYNNPSDHEVVYLGVCTFDVTNVLNKDWYKTYQRKKHFAIDLTLQENVKDLRELEASTNVLIGYIKNRELVTKGGIKDPDVIIARLDSVFTETKSIYSIVSKDDVFKKVKGFIALEYEIYKASEELNRPHRRKPLTDKQKEELRYRIDVCKKELNNLYSDNIRLLNLYIEYLSIDDSELKKDILNLCEKYKIDLEAKEK